METFSEEIVPLRWGFDAAGYVEFGKGQRRRIRGRRKPPGPVGFVGLYRLRKN
jgi:hypothetical protein